VFGYALAAAVIPGAIAYAIAGRKKVRNPNKFALSFLLLSIFFLLLELAHR
jgi:dipeptide/tripeptide permease